MRIRARQCRDGTPFSFDPQHVAHAEAHPGGIITLTFAGTGERVDVDGCTLADIEHEWSSHPRDVIQATAVDVTPSRRPRLRGGK